MRLWLSLVVDYDGDEPPPLPNLDFKIEAGDSLTAPDPSGTIQMDLSRGSRIQDLFALKTNYLKGHGEEKKRLRRQIEEIKQEISAWIHPDGDIEGFDWQVEFAEVFAEGGFDAVIANPPYGLSIGDNVRNLYFDRRADGPQSKDSYGIFMARALQLLRSGGQFSFIVSDTWRTIKSHKPLRKRLLEHTTVAHVLDLPQWIFGATVNTCILTLAKGKAPEGHMLVAGDLRSIRQGDWETLEKNLAAVSGHNVDMQTTTYAHYTFSQDLITTYQSLSFFIGSPNQSLSFFIGSPKLHSLMEERRENQLTRLGDIADAVHGISTGNNKKYVRVEPDVGGRYELIEDEMKMPTEEMQRLTGEEKKKGIDKDWTRPRGCFVPFEKGGSSDASGGWLPNYHVPTKYWINWAKGAIVDMRTNKGAAWKNEKYFFKPGLTFSISGVYAPTFRFNSVGVFEAKGSGIFCEDMPLGVLLGILCSRLARYQFKTFIKHTVDTSGDDIKELRFPMPDAATAEKLENLVAKVVEKQKEDLRYPYHLHEQKELDALVYELYGLTEEDIREVELWFCRRYPILAEAQGLLQEVHEKYAETLAHCERVLEKPPSYWKSHPALTLIAEGEGQKLEFKETLEVDIKTGERNRGLVQTALKTVAAFLNTEGGTLLIGVSDSGEIKGIDRDLRYSHRNNRDGFEQKLRSLLNDRFDPVPHGKVIIEFDDLPEGTR